LAYFSEAERRRHHLNKTTMFRAQTSLREFAEMPNPLGEGVVFGSDAILNELP
jgi:hypothetical protein